MTPPAQPAVAEAKEKQGRLNFLRSWLKLRLRWSGTDHQEIFNTTLVWAGLVGFLGALASVGFREALAKLSTLITGIPGPAEGAAASLALPLRILIPTLGGLAAGVILSLGSRLATSARSADFMEAVTLGKGEIRVRATLVRSLSSLVTNASGGSIGREGPMVQLAAMLASLTARLGRLSTAQSRLLVSCGAAAGIACAYNAPLTGALFVAEILLGTIAMTSFGPLVFASVVATVTAQQFLHSPPVYQMPPNLFEHTPNWTFLAHTLLGLIAGLLASPFLAFLRATERGFQLSKLSLILKLGFGGLIVGLVSLHEPSVWGNGYLTVTSILNSPWTFLGLLDILICKLVATGATTGSGAVGGIFTPTLFCGAVIGALFGEGLEHLLPGSNTSASGFAVVGMGCFLAAATRAPIMSILIIFEMTRSYGAVMPLMLACATAYFVARHVGGESMYSRHLRQQTGPGDLPLFLLHVRDVMKTQPLSLLATASFEQIVLTFSKNTNKHLYVVNAQNRFLGAISLQDLKPFLRDRDIPAMVIALDLVQEEIPILSGDLPLKESLSVFVAHDGERLPVVNNLKERRLIGALAKTDVLLTLTHGVGLQI